MNCRIYLFLRLVHIYVAMLDARNICYWQVFWLQQYVLGVFCAHSWIKKPMCSPTFCLPSLIENINLKDICMYIYIWPELLTFKSFVLTGLFFFCAWLWVLFVWLCFLFCGCCCFFVCVIFCLFCFVFVWVCLFLKS